jgi:sulfite exporter TauE/SafE
MRSAILFSGMALGLANNIGCIAMCAPVFMPYLFSQDKKPLVPLAQFMLGRLAAYLLFGATAGWLGIYFDGRVDVRIFSVMTLILSLWMIGNALGTLKPGIRFCGPIHRSAGATFPLYAGFVLGLNICPPFLMGLSSAMAMKNIMQPLLFFFGFYIGSSAWLLPLALTGAVPRKPLIMKLGNIVALLVGLWYLGRSIMDIFIVFR